MKFNKRKLKEIIKKGIQYKYDRAPEEYTHYLYEGTMYVYEEGILIGWLTTTVPYDTMGFRKVGN